MELREVQFDGTFEGWRKAAREEVLRGAPPETLVWRTASEAPSLELFEKAQPRAGRHGREQLRAPRRFVEMASVVSRHSSGSQWVLLYRMLWLQHHEQPHLLENLAHPDVLRALAMEKEVRRDAYRIVAFVRFRKVSTEHGDWYVAWIEPEHDSLELAADHFVKRYSNMRWSILTPRQCAHWNLGHLQFTQGSRREDAPKADDVEPLWLTYYSNIFNPARVNVEAMRAQLPKKTWKNLVEAKAIAPALAKAPGRVQKMLDDSASDARDVNAWPSAPVPDSRDLSTLREAVARCKACPLYARATCAVFGEGPRKAEVMLVGEQPGNAEDQAGKPFIGPAGQMLNRALADAGVDRDQLYVTNAVKHFKWVQRGKLHMHSTPNKTEIAACRPWLQAEIEAVKPRLIVSLGGSAAFSLLGRTIKVMGSRGNIVTRAPVSVLATIHPSMLLRLPSDEDKKQGYEAFVRDLSNIRKFLSDPNSSR